jgi:radical SAM protein with 4Fe4S-binding SPASM domain
MVYLSEEPVKSNPKPTRLAGKQPSPDLNGFYFQWHITERCNLRCSHCYQEEYTTQSEFSLAQLKKVADEIDLTLEKWNMNGRIALTGGEPFLREELLPLIEHLEKKPNIKKIGVLTNGTLIDEAIVNKLKSFPKFFTVQISLDGASEETNDSIRGRGVYQKAIKSIRLLNKKGIKARLMFTVHKQNLQDVPALIDLAIREGVNAVTIERFVPVGTGSEAKNLFLTREEIHELYEYVAQRSEKEYKNGTPLIIWKCRSLWANIAPEGAKYGDVPKQIALGSMCAIGINSLTILPDGTVLSCRRLPIPIGNIQKDTIYNIWHKSKLLWEIRDKNNLKGKCNGCKLLARCSGCRAIAYAVAGDYLAEDPQCWK